MSAYRMNIVISLCLAVIFIAVHLTDGQSDFQYESALNRDDSIEQRKYCGKRLSATLQRLCNGVYNTMFKKSDQEMEVDYPYESYLKPKRTANSMVNFGFRRESRGIHDECCVKPCSILELTSYCGN